MSHHHIKNEEKINRFNRIIGQLSGIREMVKKDRDCPDILIQIASARAALAKIGLLMAHDHLEHCVPMRGKNDKNLSSLLKAMKQMLN